MHPLKGLTKFTVRVIGVIAMVGVVMLSTQHSANASVTYYSFLNMGSSRCLDVRGGETATGNGVPLQQFTCHRTSNQLFSLIKRGSYYEIKAHHSGKCLDVVGGAYGIYNNTPIQQYTCLGTTNQLWEILPFDGFSWIAPQSAPDKCIEVAGGSKAQYADIVQYTQERVPTFKRSQLWLLEPMTFH